MSSWLSPETCSEGSDCPPVLWISLRIYPGPVPAPLFHGGKFKAGFFRVVLIKSPVCSIWPCWPAGQGQGAPSPVPTVGTHPPALPAEGDRDVGLCPVALQACWCQERCTGLACSRLEATCPAAKVCSVTSCARELEVLGPFELSLSPLCLNHSSVGLFLLPAVLTPSLDVR